MAKRIIIVGAGIIGAAIAWNLARRGLAVTVVEAGEAGGLATRNSWAWINASWGNPEAYFRLRVRSMEEWSELNNHVPGVGFNRCGGLIWDLEPAALEAYASERQAWRFPIRRVEKAEFQGLEPNVSAPPDFAFHVPEEGMVEPVAATLALLEAARRHGAEILEKTPIKWLIEAGTRISGVMTDDGPIHADEIIVAAGSESAALLDTVGIKLRLDAPAGLLVHSRVTGPLLNGLVMSPGLHLRQTADGRVVAGTDFAGVDPDGDAAALAAELQMKVRTMLKGADDLGLDFYTIGYRPTPADGFPAVGRPRNREGLFVAVMHSGVTLAPVIGLLAAREIVEDVRDRLLAPFHPDRPSLT